MNIRRSVPLIFLFSILLSLPASASAEPFIVSGNPNAPPIVWEEHEKLTGLAPDLMKSIFDELAIPYNLRRFGNWKNVQTKAQHGEIDMLLSAYKNKERENYLVFTEPYLSQPAVIVVKKGKEFKFTTWDTLIGKKGVTNVGESYGQKFDVFSTEKLAISYFEFERAIELLKLGEVDYLIVDLYTALIYARLLQGEDAITILDPPLTIQDFHFAIRKDSKLVEYLPQINKALMAKVKDGEVAKSFMGHFDNWKQLTDRRSGYFSADKKARSSDQESYQSKQDEMARERIMKTMVDREGPPDAAQ